MSVSLIIHRNGGKKAVIRHMFYKLMYTIKGFSYVDNPRRLTSIDRIVFVCKGNICRSALAHHHLVTLGFSNVYSFGLDTHENMPANKRFMQLSADKGIDLSLHRTSTLEMYKFRKNDLLVCMEPWQCKEIKLIFPNSKATLLGLFLKNTRPYIHDPYSAYESYALDCIDMIKDATKRISISSFLLTNKVSKDS